MSLEQPYSCTYKITSPTTLYVKIVNNETGKIKEEKTITIEDFALLNEVENLIGFPLEEYEHGLLKSTVTIQSLVNSIIKQIKS